MGSRLVYQVFFWDGLGVKKMKQKPIADGRQCLTGIRYFSINLLCTGSSQRPGLKM